MWLMHGGAIQACANPQQIALQWQFLGTGDLNHDGRSDIVWRHTSTGNLAFWWMDGANVLSFHNLRGPTSDWTFSGVADISADGVADLLWRHTTTGNVAIWLINADGTVGMFANPATATSDWSLQGAGIFD
jgi:hypothetical protein